MFLLQRWLATGRRASADGEVVSEVVREPLVAWWPGFACRLADVIEQEGAGYGQMGSLAMLPARLRTPVGVAGGSHERRFACRPARIGLKPGRLRSLRSWLRVGRGTLTHPGGSGLRPVFEGVQAMMPTALIRLGGPWGLR